VLKARELKKHIDSIRTDYKKMMKSKDTSEARAPVTPCCVRHLLTSRLPQAQLAVTTYLVDKLALRAGGEKDEDLADTVGVCTLRVSASPWEASISRSHACVFAGRSRAARPAEHAEIRLPGAHAVLGAVVVLSDVHCVQGKDSIRYLQEHEVLPGVYEAIGQFAVGSCIAVIHGCGLVASLTHASYRYRQKGG